MKERQRLRRKTTQIDPESIPQSPVHTISDVKENPQPKATAAKSKAAEKVDKKQHSEKPDKTGGDGKKSTTSTPKSRDAVEIPPSQPRGSLDLLDIELDEEEGGEEEDMEEDVEIEPVPPPKKPKVLDQAATAKAAKAKPKPSPKKTTAKAKPKPSPKKKPAAAPKKTSSKPKDDKEPQEDPGQKVDPFILLQQGLNRQDTQDIDKKERERKSYKARKERFYRSLSSFILRC